MLNDTLKRIEKEIRENSAINAAQREELLCLVDKLKKEVSAIGETHGEDARSIARFTEASLQEALRVSRNPELIKHALEGMSLSARRFEVSHPTLTGVINNIGRVLWGIGV